jgi:cytidylate kinase
MTASPVVRTKRRLLELESKGIFDYTYEQVQKNLTERDHIDSTRLDSPLKKADDAIVIDNSDLSTEQQLKLALSMAREVIEKKSVREEING